MKIANAQIESYINKISEAKICGAMLFGFEQSLIDYRAKLISQKIVSDLSDPFLVSEISKERFVEDNSVLMDEFLSFSMLGGRKLIILRDLNSSAITALGKILKDSFSSPNQDSEQNFILIIAGNVDKNIALRKFIEDSPYFAAIACYEDSSQTITKFIEDKFRQNNINFEAGCAEYLMEQIGKNRQIIELEIAKIADFLEPNQKLTTSIISQTSALIAEAQSDEFINNFVSANFAQSLICGEDLLKNGFEAIGLMRFLSNYLIKLQTVKTAINQGLNQEFEIKAQRLFFKQEIEFRKHLKLIELKQIAFYLKKLAELELKIKTSNISGKFLLLSFLQALGKKQNLK